MDRIVVEGGCLFHPSPSKGGSMDMEREGALVVGCVGGEGSYSSQG